MNVHAPSLPLKKRPRTHQLEALAGVDLALEAHNRAKVVMACATGKTLVELWASERRAVAQTIVFVPTLSLMSQTCQEWCAQQGGDIPFRHICVCSDETVDAPNDTDSDHFQSFLDTEEFKPTTDPALVRRFLAASADAFDRGQRSVVFCTYASAPVVAQAMRGIDGEFDLPPFELGIFDEAHKTVGTDGKLNAYALADQRLPIRQRLFFTATPKIVETVETAHDHHSLRVVSMDNRHLYGDVAYSLGFGEAARQGLITRFQVVASFVNDANLTPEELLSSDAKRIADTRALQLAMKELGARKAITFHSRVDGALAFAQGISPSDMPAFHVNGKMKIRDRTWQLSAFGRASSGVMTNANCLTEGIDVPTVDVVAFMDPRQDVVGIGQAAGRAMRTAPGKDLGFILVPLRVDLAAGETVDQAIDRGNFHQIIQVLRSLTENDGEEGAWTTRLAGALESHDGAPPLLRLVGLGEAGDLKPASIDVARIRDAITTRILFGDGGFEAKIRQLQVFKEANGHCEVPAKYPDGLGGWVQRQRNAAKNSDFPEDRRARLDAMGFVWDAFDAKEEQWFEELKAFGEKHGHFLVPKSHPGGLGKWVVLQRAKAKLPGYPEGRRARLDSMGFVWNALDAREAQRFEELEAFKNEYGHSNVPAGRSDALGQWVANQRRTAKLPGYPDVRRSRLDAMGFAWSVRDAREDQWFEELEAFKKEHGHCNVPVQYPGGLGAWASAQRHSARTSGYPNERRARLDAMGFDWANRIDAVEEARLNELEAFAKEHGHCNVPGAFPGGLGVWVQCQRRAAKRSDYPEDRRAKLTEIGIAWSVPDVKESQWFERLEAFKQEYGHCNVPQFFPNGLGTWVSNQRAAAKKPAYPEGRRSRLNEMGFEWKAPNAREVQRLEELEAFKKEHGHCNVPEKHPGGLGLWVGQQRQSVKDPQYSQARRARLDAMGFVWNTLDVKEAQRFEELEAYKREHGHCNVPTTHPGGLGMWAHDQRRQARKPGYPERRRERLDGMGFVWNGADAREERWFDELVAFRQKHGHCNVPSARSSGLYNWVVRQRSAASEPGYSPERRARLDAMNFDWRPPSASGGSEPAESQMPRQEGDEVVDEFEGDHEADIPRG